MNTEAEYADKLEKELRSLEGLPVRGPDAPNEEAASSIFPKVTVDGVEIPAEEIFKEAQNHPADTRTAALAAAAQALVVRQLLLQEANALGLSVKLSESGSDKQEPEDEALVRILIEDQVDVPVATDSECRQFYQKNPNRFMSEPLYEARHILLSAVPEETERRRQLRTAAEELITHLQKHPEDFTELVKTHSDCPSKSVNGSLGQLSRGSTVREFEVALGFMEEGTISNEPVESKFGFHIIALDRKISGEQLPYDAVAERIAAWLGASSWSRAVAQYVRVLISKSKISGISLDGSEGVLVQ